MNRGRASDDWLLQKREKITRYSESVGFYLPNGISIGSIADGYLEFSWGVLLMFYVLGRLYTYVWRQHRMWSGIWSVINYLMLTASIYLPTQSIAAWGVRLLFMVVRTLLAWKFWLHLPIAARAKQRTIRPVRAVALVPPAK